MNVIQPHKAERQDNPFVFRAANYRLTTGHLLNARSMS